MSYLTEELVRQGHDVTLFASGDSRTQRATGAGCRPRPLRLEPRCRGPARRTMVRLLEQVVRDADASSTSSTSTSTTSTSRSCAGSRTPRRHHPARPARPAGPAPLFQEFRRYPLVSISDAQREPLPWANWLATVYHGLPRTCHRSRTARATYLAFLGRISPEKRLDRAIEIARRGRLPLQIAAKVDRADARLLRARDRAAAGARSRRSSSSARSATREKDEFLGNARAAAVPDRLARAVRPGDDRGDGLRHAGDRLPQRLGARGDRGRRHRLHRRRRRGGGGGRAAPLGARPRAACRAAFERALHASTRMARDYLEVYQRLVTSAPRRAQGRRRLRDRAGGRRSSHPGPVDSTRTVSSNLPER